MVRSSFNVEMRLRQDAEVNATLWCVSQKKAVISAMAWILVSTSPSLFSIGSKLSRKVLPDHGVSSIVVQARAESS